MRKKTGDWRLETGGRRLEAGGWRLETGDSSALSTQHSALLLVLLLLALLALPLPAIAAEGSEAAPAPWWHTPLQIFNFVALFGLLGYLLRKPAGEFFTGRTRAIQQGVAEARAAREQAEKRLAEIEERLKRLGEEIGALEAGAGREAAAERDRLRAAAEAEVEKILAAAESEITTMTRAARLELKSYAAQLAVELAEQRLSSEMNPEMQERLLRAHVRDLSGGQTSAGRPGAPGRPGAGSAGGR